MKLKFKIYLPGYLIQACICLLTFTLCYNNNVYAQSKDSLKNADNGFESQSNQQKSSFGDLNDTANISLDDSDKIMRWKHSLEFAYMHYLDSLLRKQKNIRSDTVSINEDSGKIIRKNKSGNEVLVFNKILNSLPLKIFFWTLALIFIGFTAYKVLFKNGIFSGKKDKSREENEEEFSLGLDDISKYDSLISDAEKRNDFNLCVRYSFLKTLKILSERGFINFTPEKTNQEYLYEMRTNNYFDEFQSLTRNYEYLWYGKFLIEEKNYQKLKEKFILFNKKV